MLDTSVLPSFLEMNELSLSSINYFSKIEYFLLSEKRLINYLDVFFFYFSATENLRPKFTDDFNIFVVCA